MKKPRVLTAKYAGHCDTCHRHIDVGETILWHRRGVVECSDCVGDFDTLDNDDTISINGPATNTAIDRKNFSDVYSWDDTPPTPYTTPTPSRPSRPSQPQQSQQSKQPPRSVYHIKPSKTVDIVPTHVNPDTVSTVTPANNLRSNDPQVQTVCDVLVTLINATQRLTREQCHDTKHFCDAMAQISDDATRKRLYELAAHGVEM